MPKVKTEWGFILEPPYTPEEELELYRRMSGVVSFSTRPLHPEGRKTPSGQQGPEAQHPYQVHQKDL